MKEFVSAAEMALSNGIDPKRFRAALRKANLEWHSHNERWLVPRGGPEHADMTVIMEELLRRDG